MDRSPRLRAVAKTGAGALLLTAAVVAGPAQSALAGVPAFYTPPATLPSDNGALVRSESMKLGVNISTPSGNATRIMYKSIDTNGNPVAVTGTYIEPSAKWSGTGPRPLVSYAEGTQGQGDLCAPSFGLQNAVGGAFGSTNISYEVPNIASLVNKGVAVVVTDYIGLGTTDRIHTYVNRVDEAHAVLDAARAATRVTGASVTTASPVATFGYSQGGGASAAAAELQPTYAPDVNLKGAYAGAPPADLGAVMKTADGTDLTAVIGYAVNGFLQTYPQLQSILDANTNAAGKAALNKISGQCVADSIAAYGFQKTSSWTTSGKSISQIVAENPAAQAVVDAQRIGRLKPTVPVRITTGTRDDIVTHGQVKQLATDWCGLGANVTYVPVRQYVDTYGTALNHLGPSVVDSSGAQNWILDRLKGVATSSNCSSVPSLP
ncbi:MAG: lipase family protein [Solirubrobacteraceae bacterium]|nr:alpha/beta fold hydrolase [Patulibacter sp.]